jgi:hypothetical protein
VHRVPWQGRGQGETARYGRATVIVDEKDIYRAAWKLIKAHGADAKGKAMRLHNRVP